MLNMKMKGILYGDILQNRKIKENMLIELEYSYK